MEEKELRKFVGSKIKEFRLKNKMTQKTLGEKIGVAHNTVSQYENGEKTLGQDSLFLMADIFDVSIDDFFPARENVNNLEEIISDEDFDVSDIEFLRQLIEKAKSLSSDDREVFMQNIRLAIEFFEKNNK